MFNILEGAMAGSNPASMIIMLIAMVAIFYFLLIRPENKRKKEAEELRSSLKVGDEVTTIGGIVGKVVSIKEEKFVIETGADQVRIELAKWALLLRQRKRRLRPRLQRRQRKTKTSNITFQNKRWVRLNSPTHRLL